MRCRRDRLYSSDGHQPSRQQRGVLKLVVDSLGQRIGFELVGAQDDPRMAGLSPVEPGEVSSVVRDHSTALSGREGEHLGIRDSEIGLAGLQ